MSALEALLVTATTLEQIEATLTAENERDIRAAVHLACLEVARLVDEEAETPGRHHLLTD